MLVLSFTPSTTPSPLLVAASSSSFLASPLTEVRAINLRLDLVEHFVTERLRMEAVRSELRQCEDIERGVQRIGMRKSGGAAREMRALVSTVRRGEAIARLMREDLRWRERGNSGRASPAEAALSPLLSLLSHPSLSSLASLLDRALVDEPPLLLESGHFIRHSYHPPLSSLSSQSSTTQQRIVDLQHSLRQALSLPLKIKRNTGIGYYIELSTTRGQQLEEKRRAGLGGEVMQGLSLFQQLKGEWRYKSKELIGLQNDLHNAGEEMLAEELRVFEALREEVLLNAALLHSLSQALSTLDVYTSLAHLALDMAYTRPTVVEVSPEGEDVFDVVGGRHPVVESRMHALYRDREKEGKKNKTAEEQSLQVHEREGEGEVAPTRPSIGTDEGKEAEWGVAASTSSTSIVPSSAFSTSYESSLPYVDFIPNDCSLRTLSSRLCLLTGPNMSGQQLLIPAHLALLGLFPSPLISSHRSLSSSLV